MIRGVTLMVLLAVASGCVQSTPMRLVKNDSADSNYNWKTEIGDAFGAEGVLREGVYTITIPRSDIDVTIDGMSVPTAAGIFSTFRFYRCTCGKISVLGEFVCEDFEVNDVIDSLHLGSAIRLAGMGPLAIGEKPRLMSVRIQGEGEGPDLAKRIKSAMKWMGEERSKPARKFDE